MAAMETTVVATAMPTVVADLGALELYGWVGAVYLLGNTVAMPIYGKLSDIYGRKSLMMVGITLFLIGSMASGLSQSMVQLIAFRGLQALGAGGLQTLAFTVAGDIYEVKERARIQGIFGAVWAIAGMSGPFLGGLLVKFLSWRWVFYVNVPVGVLAAFLYVVAFHESVAKRPAKLDIPGALVVTAMVVSLLLGTSRVAPAITIPLAIGFGVIMMLVERRAEEPVIPLDLLRQKVIGLSCILGGVVGATMMSVVTYLPLYLQGILGTSATTAGSMLSPLLIGWPLAATLTGRILSRLSYRTIMIFGWTLATASLVVLSVEIANVAAPGVLYAIMFFLGLGLGFANTPIILVLQESVTWRQRGQATAASSFFRTIGGSIAVGALGAILAGGLAGLADPRLLSEIMGPEHGHHLDPALMGRISAQLETSLVTIFRIIAAMAASALALALFFPPLRLGQGEASLRERQDGALDDGPVGQDTEDAKMTT
ncbi:MFS transporter [Pendulispora brunnea]|uniref:MFS transporter n=2 Tax=Pendulispora brunnea TaxID=2905690 RepID=A0ABZ2KNN9_9BACT